MSDHGAARSGVRAVDRSSRRSLPASLALTVASALVPGSGLLGARRPGLRVLGALTTVASLAVLGWVGYQALTDPPGLVKLGADRSMRTAGSLALIVVAVVWVTLVAATHLATRPRGLTGGRRALSAVLVALLSFGIAAPSALAARYARDTSLLLDKVLPSTPVVKASNQPTLATDAPDPWAGTPRVNILLLGADGNAARADQVEQFGVRTDTIMVASIDTATGNTVLIQIPRNVQRTPFPDGSEMAEAFPDGFRGEGDPGNWYVNSIWAAVDKDYPNLLEGTTYRSAEALKQGIEGITGLKTSYFVMLDIDGLQNLIEAMGGVTVNVNRDLPIGGNRSRGIRPSGYVTRGEARTLGGYEAMWYARSRYDSSDYDRMARQSCLVNAIIRDADPPTLLTNFEAIASASSEMLTTDITQQELKAIIDLAFRVKDGRITRLVFSQGKNYSYSHPDFDEMRAAVADAIAASSATPGTPAATATGTPVAPSPTGLPAASPSPSATTASPSPSDSHAPEGSPSAEPLEEGSQDVADACAWQGD